MSQIERIESHEGSAGKGYSPIEQPLDEKVKGNNENRGHQDRGKSHGCQIAGVHVTGEPATICVEMRLGRLVLCAVVVFCGFHLDLH